MAESEHGIQSKMQVELSEHHCTIFRVNVGKMRTPDGRFFLTGLPSGYPDLSGLRWTDGKASLIEIKNATNKPREGRTHFHHMLVSHGIIHGIARSVDDARMIIERGLCGRGLDD